MNPENVSTEYTDTNQNPEVVEVRNGEDAKVLISNKASTTANKVQWQQYGEQVSTFLQALPTYVGQFFSQNQGPLKTVALIVGAIVTVKLTLALLDALDDIPLIAPTLELIGLGYTGWFIYRYLLTATTRQELYGEFNKLKSQVLGTDS